ncbi:MAG: LLM class F420-dependent oxidoreductase [Actinobacteria bacterium]|nr:LLM class F420-dependent oxidoreductase [Actinomycetota bacterium]
MGRFEVGVQLYPQHTDIEQLRDAWRRMEDIGVDSIWTWDHFFPITGDDAGEHFEGWSLMAAKAVLTERPRVGVLVTCNAYRNANLLADMARTVDHLSGGRVVLGIGAGWYGKDHDEYGYVLEDPPDRLADLEDSLRTIRDRLDRLNPAPIGELPILVGGGGEKVTLRIVAEHADWWNTMGPADTFAHKCEVLDRWCDEVGRDPDDIVRTVLMNDPDRFDDIDDYFEAGASHLILGLGPPYDAGPVEELLAEARG